MKKLILFFLGLSIIGGAAWFVGYRDTTQPPRLEAADFAGLDMQSALGKLAGATVDGGAPGVVVSWLRGNVSALGAGSEDYQHLTSRCDGRVTQWAGYYGAPFAPAYQRNPRLL